MTYRKKCPKELITELAGYEIERASYRGGWQWCIVLRGTTVKVGTFRNTDGLRNILRALIDFGRRHATHVPRSQKTPVPGKERMRKSRKNMTPEHRETIKLLNTKERHARAERRRVERAQAKEQERLVKVEHQRQLDDQAAAAYVEALRCAPPHPFEARQ